MFHEIFLGNEKSLKLNAILFHLLMLSTSILFLYFFSLSTSPRYFFIGNDSIIFQVIGKCWIDGLLPYVGAFENKGPFLFAINALGYMIYPRYGIMLLQIPFMYFSLLFTWRAINLYWSLRATFIFWLFTIFWRAAIFYEGNRTEEYSMPFLLAATYFFLRWLKEEQNFLPPIIGFIYGLGFGACVLLRTTNGLPICCYVLLTTIFLIQAGAFKNIWQNFLSFCAGFAIICLPFVIYFALHGALYDMLYGTILLNINHATGYNPTTQEFFDFIVPFVIIRCNIFFWLPIISLVIICLNRKNKLAWSGLLTSSAMLFMLLKGRPFYGYIELIVSLLPIMFAAIYELKTILSPPLKKLWSVRAFSVKRFFCKVIFMFTFILVLITLKISISSFNPCFILENSEKRISAIREKQESIREFQKNIPLNERNSVVMWGESSSMGCFILETGIKPRFRFFGNVETFFGKSDPAVTEEWIQNVCNDYPKWIIYAALEKEYSKEKMNLFEYNFCQQRNPRIEKILAQKYTLNGEFELYGKIMKFYRLNEKETS